MWCRRSICRDNEQEFSKINKRQIPRKVRTQSQVKVSAPAGLRPSPSPLLTATPRGLVGWWALPQVRFQIQVVSFHVK